MNRRGFLGAGAGLALAAPFALARELAKPERRKLPVVQSGAILSAAMWNDVIERINELSEAS